jgi:ABC-type nickel/cobalt efflux system permease component RcnA
MLFPPTLWYLLAGCFGLGILHGLVPDEHTWPITFAYSVGSTTGKGGIRSGAWFSLAFTAQRAMMSMIVFLVFSAALGRWGFNLATQDRSVNGPVYLAVGFAMAVAGFLILRNRIPHLHPFMRVSEKDLSKHVSGHGARSRNSATVPTHWCVIHGFISGFGTDTSILTTWIYLTTIPVLASAGLWGIGWLPGALFGLGTFVVLMFIGFFFGEALHVSKRVGPNRIANFGRLVGARTLFYGGIAFMLFSPLYWSGWYTRNVTFDPGQFIVILIMVGMFVPISVLTWREVRTLPREFPSETFGGLASPVPTVIKLPTEPDR